jgi:hypothetical protein
MASNSIVLAHLPPRAIAAPALLYRRGKGRS